MRGYLYCQDQDQKAFMFCVLYIHLFSEHVLPGERKPMLVDEISLLNKILFSSRGFITDNLINLKMKN